VGYIFGGIGKGMNFKAIWKVGKKRQFRGHMNNQEASHYRARIIRKEEWSLGATLRGDPN